MDLDEKNGMTPKKKEIDLHATIDAFVWAKEFMRLQEKFGYMADEETMIGWFANSIMCGYDKGKLDGLAYRDKQYGKLIDEIKKMKQMDVGTAHTIKQMTAFDLKEALKIVEDLKK